MTRLALLARANETQGTTVERLARLRIESRRKIEHAATRIEVFRNAIKDNLYYTQKAWLDPIAEMRERERKRMEEEGLAAKRASDLRQLRLAHAASQQEAQQARSQQAARTHQDQEAIRASLRRI